MSGDSNGGTEFVTPRKRVVWGVSWGLTVAVAIIVAAHIRDSLPWEARVLIACVLAGVLLALLVNWVARMADE